MRPKIIKLPSTSGGMKPTRITVHCADTKNGVNVPASEIRSWHLARGFNDIGYHFVIQPDGLVEYGRALNVQGAHVEGANPGNIGICMPGKDKYTRKQWDTLRQIIDELSLEYGIKPWEITTHNQHKSAITQGKVCPGLSVNVLLSWYIGFREDAIKPHLIEG